MSSSLSLFSSPVNVAALAGKSGKVSKQASRTAAVIDGLSLREVNSVALAGGSIGKAARVALESQGFTMTLAQVMHSLEGSNIRMFVALLAADIGGTLPAKGDSWVTTAGVFIDANIKKMEAEELLEGGLTKAAARKASTLYAAQHAYSEFMVRRAAAIEAYKADAAAAEATTRAVDSAVTEAAAAAATVTPKTKKSKATA